MPYFTYICVDALNQYFEGKGNAENKADLARLLSEQKLFLVWWGEEDIRKTITVGDAASPHQLTPVTDTAAQTTMMSLRKLVEAPPPTGAGDPGARVSPRRRLPISMEKCLGGILGIALGIIVPRVWMHGRPPVPPELASIRSKTAPLHLGMTRHDVESLLPNRAKNHVQLSSATYYVEPGGWLLQIRYDGQGGPWNENNRMQGGRISLGGLLARDLP